ncbi:VCBS domain-containing protein [Pseudoalteromonas carrageenovora]|uniref:VCBS domain-containing protein n=1 Tax=Pseudoalteromonas carrageenovora TaxID=227 RepID=UPI002119125D|nr:VCBS domain-containing protein [Pseudoalteromonas carrageenovora]MCQ8890041.1 VCBS domain-containing protein [Pseudoalteromonas carrageenovora]
MSKFGLRVLTISSVCSLGILAVGCGSSGSKSEPVNASVVAQSAAVISGQTAVSIESSREIAITGELSITDAQTNEAVFKAQNNNATAYGSFSLTEDGNWSYTVNVDYATVSALSEGETLFDEVIVTSADGTTATVSITIIGTAGSDDFIVSEETVLNADGANTGLSAYKLVENAFSEGSIESPDIYSGNHQGVEHIIEDTDSIIGNHFVFLAHRDDDQDKDKGATDRQRNEIKAYDKSPAATLAFKGETVQYTWKFKVSSELELSSKFSHFFQIKARNDSNDNTNGNHDQPIITLSGAQKNSTGNQLQVRYSAGFDENGNSTGLDKNLIETDWSLITDEWVAVFVQATFSEEGKFDMTLTRLSDNEELFNISEQNIDMWRGFSNDDFARPKWGVYRSIAETDSLRAEEEQVRFADFVIKKGVLTK